MKHSYNTKLSPEQFLDVLRFEGVEEKQLWQTFGLQEKLKHVYYTIDGNTFQLVKPSYWRYPLQPKFYGTVTAEKHGSIIEGEFRMPDFVKVFLWIWATMAGGILFIMLQQLIPALFDGRIEILSGLPILFFLLFFVSITAGMFYFSMYLRKKEETEVISFIEKLSTSRAISQHPSARMPTQTELHPLHYLYILWPFAGAFLAWKTSESNEVGIFMLAGAVISSIYIIYKIKKK